MTKEELEKLYEELKKKLKTALEVNFKLQNRLQLIKAQADLSFC